MDRNLDKDDFFYSYFFKKDEININGELIMITSRNNDENRLIQKKIEEIKTNIKNIKSNNLVNIDKSENIDDNIDCKYSDETTPLTTVPSIKIRIQCNKIYDVIYIIKKLKEFGFLNEKNDKLFLNNNLEFNWKNLSELNIRNDDELFIRIVFWYFRKIAVESIIYDIVEYYKDKLEYNCKKIDYVGTGSNHITSDYDITLSGTNNKCTARIIYKYYKIVKYIFKETSETVFDTNLYGTDYIDHEGSTDSELKVIKTDNSECIYDNSELNIKSSINPIFDEIFAPQLESELYTIEKSMSTLALNAPSEEESNVLSNKKMCDKIDQRVWAYIKFILNYKKKTMKNKSDIQDIFKEKIIWEKAIDFLFNNPKDDSAIYSTYYGLLILMSDKLIQRYNVNNYISLVNYFGNETYFTRGAFIDVVVNQQILKDKDIIKLDDDEYINSFIENISDYIYHDFKQKYLERCESISSKLNGKFDDIIVYLKKNQNLTIEEVYDKIKDMLIQLDDKDLNKILNTK